MLLGTWILYLVTPHLSHFRWFPVLTSQSLHLAVFSRVYSTAFVLLGSAFPTLPFAHSFTGSYDVNIEFLLHSRHDTRLQRCKDEKGDIDSFCFQGVLVGGYTSKWSETIAKGSMCADSEYCAVPSIASSLAP